MKWFRHKGTQAQPAAQGRGAGMTDVETWIGQSLALYQQNMRFAGLSRCRAALENQLLEDMTQHPAERWVSQTLPEDSWFLIPPVFTEVSGVQGMLTRGHEGPKDMRPSLEEPKPSRKERKSPQMTLQRSA